MEEVVVFPSEARIATPTPKEFQNYNEIGGIFIIDATAVTATPSVVFNLEGKDPASGKWYLILASAAVTVISTVVLRVYPGLTAAANLSVSDVLPKTIRIRPVHADADSITYTVGCILI